jgi:hypothetical protein
MSEHDATENYSTQPFQHRREEPQAIPSVRYHASKTDDYHLDGDENGDVYQTKENADPAEILYE